MDEDILQIMRQVPHRYPFLLIDRVLEFKRDESLTAVKNVTINEPFFQGHFPGRPVMPGVLIIEALAQASLLLAYRSVEEVPEDMIFYFAGIDKARFKRPVVPGDQLLLTAQLQGSRRNIWKFSAQAHVDDKLACQADLMAMPVAGQGGGDD